MARGRLTLATAYDEYEKKRKIQWIFDLKSRLQESGGWMLDKRGHLAELNRATIFLTNKPIRSIDDPIPTIFRIYVRTNGAIPKYIIFLHIHKVRQPHVDQSEHEIIKLGDNLFSVTMNVGFMDECQTSFIFDELKKRYHIDYDFSECNLEIGEEDVYFRTMKLPILVNLRIRLYKILSRLATPVDRFFSLNTSYAVSTTRIPVVVTRDSKQRAMVQLSKK